MKTSTKRKAISKKADGIVNTYASKGDIELDQPGIDNDLGIDVPLHARGLTSKWNFQKTKKRMPWYDKVTWVLTAVNVVILISLVIKNV